MEKKKKILSYVKTRVDNKYRKCMKQLNRIIPNFDNEESSNKTYSAIAEALKILNGLDYLEIKFYLSDDQKEKLQNKLEELTENDKSEKQKYQVQTVKKWVGRRNKEPWEKIYVDLWKELDPKVLNIKNKISITGHKDPFAEITMTEEEKALHKIFEFVESSDELLETRESDTVLLQSDSQGYNYLPILSPNRVIEKINKLQCDFSSIEKVRKLYGTIVSLLYNMQISEDPRQSQELISIKEEINKKLSLKEYFNQFRGQDELLDEFYEYINQWIRYIKKIENQHSNIKLKEYEEKTAEILSNIDIPTLELQFYFSLADNEERSCDEIVRQYASYYDKNYKDVQDAISYFNEQAQKEMTLTEILSNPTFLLILKHIADIKFLYEKCKNLNKTLQIIEKAEEEIEVCHIDAIIPDETSLCGEEMIAKGCEKICKKLEKILDKHKNVFQGIDQCIQIYIDTIELLTSKEFKSIYPQCSSKVKKDIKSKLDQILKRGDPVWSDLQFYVEEKNYIQNAKRYIKNIIKGKSIEAPNDLIERQKKIIKKQNKRKGKIREFINGVRIFGDTCTTLFESTFYPMDKVRKCETNLKKITPKREFNSIKEERQYLENIINAVLPLCELLVVPENDKYRQYTEEDRKDTIELIKKYISVHISRLIEKINMRHKLNPTKEIMDRLCKEGHLDYAINSLAILTSKNPYVNTKNLAEWLIVNKEIMENEKEENEVKIYDMRSSEDGKFKMVVEIGHYDCNGEFIEREEGKIRKEIDKAYREYKKSLKEKYKVKKSEEDENKKRTEINNKIKFIHDILTQKGCVFNPRIFIDDLNNIIYYFGRKHPRYSKIKWSDGKKVNELIKEVKENDNLAKTFIAIYYKYFQLKAECKEKDLHEKMLDFINQCKSKTCYPSQEIDHIMSLRMQRPVTPKNTRENPQENTP